ncbi:MAG: serine/threonine-protein kinase [Planctomycetaceae bacterium]|nr:serine/threonine-protein kinase [Planctomycetaceae bacterium]
MSDQERLAAVKVANSVPETIDQPRRPSPPVADLPPTLPPSRPLSVQRAGSGGADDVTTDWTKKERKDAPGPDSTIDYDPADAANRPTLHAAGDDTVSDRAPRPVGIPRIGDYEIEHELGRGGMGVVYRARHSKLGRTVALKMILAGPHADEAVLTRFRVEGQAVARLQHPGIVQIFELGEHGGLPYFVLEYVAGKSLLHRIVKELPPPAEAARLVEQLARTMQYAHDQGILHRDLKPANVLLTPDGEPKVSDFGLAKSQGTDSAATASGTILGTPSYMSPEQARGVVTDLTPATDQYSLSAILYHLLTGRAPFVAANPLDTLIQVMNEEPVAPRQLSSKTPVDLETICLKALAKEPARRYASCRELADDLKRFLDNEPIVARPISRAERLWRWCRRNPRIAIPTAASVLLFLIAFAAMAISAVALSNLNTKLRAQTTAAQTAKTQAQEEATKANEERTMAEDRADVLLQAAEVNLTETQKRIGTTPNLQPLKREIVLATARTLEKLPHMTGRSGRTKAATLLVYHRLMYRMYLETGETDKAWAHIVEAHEIARQRVIDQNNSNASRMNLAAICKDMAQIRLKYERDVGVALNYAREAVSLYEDILANPRPQPGDPPRLNIVLLLSRAYPVVATLFVRLGNPSEALRHFEMSESVREGILTDPEFLRLEEAQRKANEASLLEESVPTLAAIGEMQFRLGDHEAASQKYDEAVAIREKVLTDLAGESEAKQLRVSQLAKRLLAEMLSQAGSFYSRIGEPQKASVLLERAVKLCGELAAADPTIVDYHRILALAHFRTGTLQASQGDSAAARASFEACLKIRTELAKDESNADRQRELLLVLARAGKHREAAAQAAKVLAQVPNPDIEILLDLARAAASSSVAAADDPQAAAEYRKQALAHLTKAVDAGHRDPHYLETEPDLANLWNDDQFRALLAREREAAKATK